MKEEDLGTFLTKALRELRWESTVTRTALAAPVRASPPEAREAVLRRLRDDPQTFAVTGPSPQEAGRRELAAAADRLLREITDAAP